MKKFVVVPGLFFILQVSAQPDWKQSLHYDLHVKFSPAEKSLDAIMRLQYINHSPDTLHFLWFHIWPNAYRNDRTAYSDQLLENGDTRFYFSSREQKGYINRLDFRVNESLAVVEDHPEFIDVVKLILPKPLLPGDSISISCSFHVRMPFNFNGNGYNSDHFELRNWYPEPAVYDPHGWHPMPFLLQGGAYHEAADYDVQLESPSGYQIVAGACNTVVAGTAGKTFRYKLMNANAFAWVADRHFLMVADTVEIAGGLPVRIQFFYNSENSAEYGKILATAKKEIRLLTEWLCPYPNETISIVEAAPMKDQNFSGLVCIGTHPRKNGWEAPLRRALIGQWFQTIIMNDQRNMPWFSEGFMNYYDLRLEKYLSQGSLENRPFSDSDLLLRIAENEKTSQPVATPAPEFSKQNDPLIPGFKASMWLGRLRDVVGNDRFDRNMKNYFLHWQFKHPYPDDFKMTMDTTGWKSIQFMFDKLSNNENFFPNSGIKVIKPVFIFSARKRERNNYIGLAPVPGFNRYDGFMLGALIHNINLPENKFQFIFTPLFTFGSKTPVGLGRLVYSWRPDRHFSKISIGVNGEQFNKNKATDSTGKAIFENFSKLVPYIRFDFKPSVPRSSISKWMDFKLYLITEKTFGRFVVSPKDSLIHPNLTTNSFRYVNQISFNLRDDRTLYPYSFRAEFQQSEFFYRINLHANYFLNFRDGGGLQVHFFAAKFGAWNKENSLLVTRYEPKLLGVNGEEDYLYEGYFIGRSASNAVENSSIPNAGLPTRQIMNRDGGLKLRIDEFDYVQGKSADWVTSINFSSSLPANLFPFPLPIKLFFDFGTYSEAWQNNAPTSRFLYTGGIELSLFRNVLNIFAPLIYSNDFKNALSSTNFGRKITFSIDIQNINYKRLIRKAAGL